MYTLQEMGYDAGPEICGFDWYDAPERFTERFNIVGNRNFKEVSGDMFDAAKDIAQRFGGASSMDTEVQIAEIMTILDSNFWTVYTLRGVCQSDVVRAVVRDDVTPAERERVAAEYFGNGRYFMVYLDGKPECSVFLSDGYDAETYANECKLRYGYDIESISMISGYTRTPVYETVKIGQN